MSYPLSGELPQDTGSVSRWPELTTWPMPYDAPDRAAAKQHVAETDAEIASDGHSPVARYAGNVAVGHLVPDGVPGAGLRKPEDDRHF